MRLKGVGRTLDIGPTSGDTIFVSGSMERNRTLQRRNAHIRVGFEEAQRVRRQLRLCSLGKYVGTESQNG